MLLVSYPSARRGTVYKGVWRGLPVALKTMVFDGSELSADEGDPRVPGGAGGGGDGGVQRSHPKAIMEAAIAASVGHRNVVRCVRACSGM
jgi:hypothetical protein